MEIKVREYVRLARGQGINKIIDIKEYGDLILDNDITDKDGDQCCLIFSQDADKEIINHSFNIIDLIEVGDIVFIEDFFGYNFIHVFDESMLEALKKDVKDGIKIKTILTHEQYERNCYRLENN